MGDAVTSVTYGGVVLTDRWVVTDVVRPLPRVIVDTEPAGPMARGHSVELAAALGARRFAIEELRADDLVSVVRDLQDSGNSRKERR